MLLDSVINLRAYIMAARDHFRAHARRRIELDATLRGRDGTIWQKTRIRDLGFGGVGVEITEPSLGEARAYQGSLGIEREASVTIDVLAPTLWDPLTLSGKIAWIKRGGQGRPTRAGIRFEHRESATLYTLFELLGAHAYES